MRFLNYVFKVLDLMFQWIRLRFLTLIFSVPYLQHLVEGICGLRQFLIVFCHPKRVTSPDRKPFAPVLYLILRSIGFSHL